MSNIENQKSEPKTTTARNTMASVAPISSLDSTPDDALGESEELRQDVSPMVDESERLLGQERDCFSPSWLTFVQKYIPGSRRTGPPPATPQNTSPWLSMCAVSSMRSMDSPAARTAQALDTLNEENSTNDMNMAPATKSRQRFRLPAFGSPPSSGSSLSQKGTNSHYSDLPPHDDMSNDSPVRHQTGELNECTETNETCTKPMIVLLEIIGATGLLGQPDNPERVDMAHINPLSLPSGRRNQVNAYCAVRVRKRDWFDSPDDAAPQARAPTDKIESAPNGQLVVHMTSTIQCDNNPIWTLTSGSLTLLKLKRPQWSQPNMVQHNVDSAVCENSYSLRIDIYHDDFHQQHNPQSIGHVVVPLQDLFKRCCQSSGGGNRVEFPIVPTHVIGGAVRSNARLALKYRIANQDDIALVEHVGQPSGCAKPSEQSKNAKRSASQESLHEAARRNDMNSRDEHRVSETELEKEPSLAVEQPCFETQGFLASSQTCLTTDDESLGASKHWNEVYCEQSNVGVLYCEVISFDPSHGHETTSISSLTSDYFVGILYEGSSVQTESLSADGDSVRWSPPSTRSFSFRVRHPASLLKVGVFRDAGPGYPQPVGRATIGIGSFDADTEYLLRYDLHSSADAVAVSASIGIRSGSLCCNFNSCLARALFFFPSPEEFSPFGFEVCGTTKQKQ
jgi:C2 domain